MAGGSFSRHGCVTAESRGERSRPTALHGPSPCEHAWRHLIKLRQKESWWRICSGCCRSTRMGELTLTGAKRSVPAPAEETASVSGKAERGHGLAH